MFCDPLHSAVEKKLKTSRVLCSLSLSVLDEITGWPHVFLFFRRNVPDFALKSELGAQK